MKTNPPNTQTFVILKDGGAQLAAWTQSFDQRPTLGESLEIPADLHTDLAGYEPHALVSRIELRSPLPDQIDLEASCRIQKFERTIIVINSSLICDSMRGDVEAYVRSKLQFPLIYWDSSTDSYPVVRFYDPASGQTSCPQAIQSGLLDLRHEWASSSLSARVHHAACDP